MACGHSGNARLPDGGPACAICMPRDEAFAIAPAPDLTGRVAQCRYCGGERPSSIELPFFEHRPGEERDRYYSGCMGWD